MAVLALMLAVAALVYVPQVLWRHCRDPRFPMRVGMAAALLFTGVDHFFSAHTRYLPMMPEFFGSAALPLVYVTGVTELLGALGLLVPVAVYRRLGLPRLRQVTGCALALMFALIVIANVNVALSGQQVEGLAFGAWYYWLRPLIQPVFILWALYATGAIWPARSTAELRGANA
jgi:uncharacterized membrane protein